MPNPTIRNWSETKRGSVSNFRATEDLRHGDFVVEDPVGSYNVRKFIENTDEVYLGVVEQVGACEGGRVDVRILEIDANKGSGVLTDQADPNDGWIQITDDQYTTSNRLTVLSGVDTVLPNNAALVFGPAAPTDAANWWNPTQSKFFPPNLWDYYIWRVQFTIDPAVNNRNLNYSVDIGQTAPILDATTRLARGAGVDTRVNVNLPVFNGVDFRTNGGQFIVNVDGDCEIYNINFNIHRVFRSGL